MFDFVWVLLNFIAFLENFLFSWPLWKYSWRLHYMRTDSATFTALCYPMLTLLVRKQMDSPYESFHQRPLMHPQAIFLVYVKDNSSIGDILPLFFLFLTPPPPPRIWDTTAGKPMYMHTFTQGCTCKSIAAQLLCSSQKDTVSLWNDCQKKKVIKGLIIKSPIIYC